MADPQDPLDIALYVNGLRQPVTSIDDAHQKASDSDGAFVWLSLREPTADEFSRIAREFDLHPLAVEDAVHAHQRPKVELFGDTLFSVLKTVRYFESSEQIELGEVMVFLGENFVISVEHGEGGALDSLSRELEAKSDVLTAGPTAVLWGIADRVVDDYAGGVAGLSDDIEEVETAVFAPSANDPTERIYKLKRETMEFRRAVEPLGPALDPLVDRSISVISERVAPYFRDVQDHALRTASRTQGFDDQLRDILNANIAQVTLRQNEDMRKITAWAAILAVVTSIAGIYGMNFDDMPELKWHYGYYGALVAMLIISGLLYRNFKRRQWL